MKLSNNLIVIFIILILLKSIPIPIIASYDSHQVINFNITNEKQLVLLRGEHYLYITAYENVTKFYIRFSFPPNYNYQVPIKLEILNDTTANIIHYQIEEDLNEPNKIINFTIGFINSDEKVLIHFNCWVLVENHEFEDLSEYVRIPKKDELPEYTKKWLTETEVVQLNRPLIKLQAIKLLGNNNNLINFAAKVAPFIKEHRYLLFILQLKLGLFLTQDSITTLIINGENVGRSHLACSFFRLNNVPARVILVHNDQGFWTQMHYMVEYYVPNYGWVLLETTKGETPYATKRQIINRICYPEDENNTKDDYILPLMKGEERWLWINNEQVKPYYIDCNKGSKSQMFTEVEISANNTELDYVFHLTENVFSYYEQFLGVNLSGENLIKFNSAITAQKNAISELKDNYNLAEYINEMIFALDQYEKILL
jgi:hypothetical protein